MLLEVGEDQRIQGEYSTTQDQDQTEPEAEKHHPTGCPSLKTQACLIFDFQTLSNTTSTASVPLNRSSSGAAAVCLVWPGSERRRCSALHSSPGA